MRIGLVSPYSFDVPGGVQAHVRDLAAELIRRGHHVSVLAPGDDEAPMPDYVVPAGRAVAVPYNGATARLSFGPLSASRVRRWVREGEFDVLHVHEPVAPSLSILACWAAMGPIVATFHVSAERSRAMSAAYGILQTALEKISARIAVSDRARATLIEHLGGDAVVIPNGVSVEAFEGAQPFDGWPGPGQAIGFLGRIDEPRKGLPILLDAFPRLATDRPGLRALVAGPGDVEDVRADVPPELRDRVQFLGLVSDEDRARMFASVDVYVAPNTGGESFGVVLLEAMAAGTPVVASDLEAFRRVLDDGACGALFANEDPGSLAKIVDSLLDDRERLQHLREAGRARVARYDWRRVAGEIEAVYETVTLGQPPVREDTRGQLFGRFTRLRET